MIWEAFKLAIRAIARNKLRSFLTTLGIVIGVGAVIAMVTIGNGATEKVKSDIAKLGSNMLYVYPGQFGRRSGAEARRFNNQDIDSIRADIAGLRAVAPVAQTSAIVVRGNESRSTGITGTDNELFSAQEWSLASGRYFADGEVRSGRAVCVLGETVREKLFGPEVAEGQRIRVKGISCEVIGVVNPKGQSSFGSDQDDVVFMPIRAVQRRIIGNNDISRIYVAASDGVSTEKVQEELENLLRERRRVAPGADDDFTVRDMKQIAQTMAGTTAMMTSLLGAVAAVSLLVGGIGIMNIMLVSVTERTREIGIRLAIGALEGQVLTQFLVEAVVLSLLGGLIGVGLGLGLAGVASLLLGIPYLVSPSIVFLAFGFSALVGMGFGYFPARRAARLDPIVALRHE